MLQHLKADMRNARSSLLEQHPRQESGGIRRFAEQVQLPLYQSSPHRRKGRRNECNFEAERFHCSLNFNGEVAEQCRIELLENQRALRSFEQVAKAVDLSGCLLR